LSLDISRTLRDLREKLGEGDGHQTKWIVAGSACAIGVGVLAFSMYRSFTPPKHDVIPAETQIASQEEAELEYLRTMSPEGLEQHIRGLRQMLARVSNGGDEHEKKHFEWQLEVANKFKQSKGS
jgi:hypothetical protein